MGPYYQAIMAEQKWQKIWSRQRRAADKAAMQVQDMFAKDSAEDLPARRMESGSRSPSCSSVRTPFSHSSGALSTAAALALDSGALGSWQGGGSLATLHQAGISAPRNTPASLDRGSTSSRCGQAVGSSLPATRRSRESGTVTTLVLDAASGALQAGGAGAAPLQANGDSGTAAALALERSSTTSKCGQDPGTVATLRVSGGSPASSHPQGETLQLAPAESTADMLAKLSRSRSCPFGDRSMLEVSGQMKWRARGQRGKRAASGA